MFRANSIENLLSNLVRPRPTNQREGIEFFPAYINASSMLGVYRRKFAEPLSRYPCTGSKLVPMSEPATESLRVVSRDVV